MRAAVAAVLSAPLISGIRDLPETGGVPLILGVVGALLVIGGLLFRKVFR